MCIPLPPRTLLGPRPSSPSRLQRCMSSGLTPMAIWLPTSLTRCASRPSTTGHKRRPSAALWARTLAAGDGGSFIQAERGARPAQAVLLPEERDAYLAGEPAEDGRFLAAFAHALEHMGGYSPAEARRVAGTLLPDVLFYDPTRPASFPDNGRTLTDDAFDMFMRILTNGKVTGDNVGPHTDLIPEFPYVGPPHHAR